uniref:Uncharacterized protein n=1 Tax=Heliothis virescens TaxID=7102 RepID=A0A2A4ITC8_HELVI
MMALMPPHTQTDDDSMEDSVQCLDDSVDSVGDYFSDRYGTRPLVPVNISEKQYMHPLALFHCCTETMPSMRPSAQHLSIAAEDMLQQCDQSMR